MWTWSWNKVFINFQLQTTYWNFTNLLLYLCKLKKKNMINSDIWVFFFLTNMIISISIGSLGASNSEAQVSNVTVDTAQLIGTQNGARIKTWQVSWSLLFTYNSSFFPFFLYMKGKKKGEIIRFIIQVECLTIPSQLNQRRVLHLLG